MGQNVAQEGVSWSDCSEGGAIQQRLKAQSYVHGIRLGVGIIR